MQANYIARKTAWSAVTFWRVVLFWLIIPLIIMIFGIIKAKKGCVEFYDDYVIVKEGGFFTKKERRSAFPGVIAVSIEQSLFGRMFGYGDVKVDVIGKWDVDLKGISKPVELQRFLESKIVSGQGVQVHSFE